MLFERAMMELSSLTASVTLRTVRIVFYERKARRASYISWLGFFFFLRMAVAVSSSSLRSAPEASLRESVSRQSQKRGWWGTLCVHQMALLLGVAWVRFGSHFDSLIRTRMQMCKRRPGLLGSSEDVLSVCR